MNRARWQRTEERRRKPGENELVANEGGGAGVLGREPGQGMLWKRGTQGVEGRTGREQRGCQATDIVPIVAGVA